MAEETQQTVEIERPGYQDLESLEDLKLLVKGDLVRAKLKSRKDMVKPYCGPLFFLRQDGNNTRFLRRGEGWDILEICIAPHQVDIEDNKVIQKPGTRLETIMWLPGSIPYGGWDGELKSGYDQLLAKELSA
ncbi:MAG: hypothetical protein ABIH37_04225 [archaeon]